MKKFLSLLLVAAMCLLCLTACGNADSTADSGSADSTADSTDSTVVDSGLTPNPDYEWTNEYGLTFDLSTLDYVNFDTSSIYDSNGRLKDFTASDYVTLPEGFDAMQLEGSAVNLTEEEIDGYVADLVGQYATVTQVTDRAVADGDTVNIDYVGSVDGVEFTGGSTGGAGTSVTIGTTNYVDDFIDQLIGHMPGDTFDVVVTFPADYSDTTDADGNKIVLANTEAVFSTTINYIAGDTITPELTDAWVEENLAATYGLTTAQAVRDQISSYYTDQNIYNAINDNLTNNSTYSEYPLDLVKYCATAMLNTQYYYATNYYGTTLSDALTQNGYASAEAFLDDNAASIIDSVKSILSQQAALEKLDLTTSESEAKEILGDYFDTYSGNYGANYAIQYALTNEMWTTLVNNAVVSD